MLFPVSELQRRVDLGLLTCRKHPRFDLWIYNYTLECQLSHNWDHYTRWSRGLILDAQGEAVALPFQKFFNLNEAPETQLAALPNEWPEVTSKEDGSLGVGFTTPSGDYEIATRGQFAPASPQAAWATQWWSERGADRGPNFDRWTYLFEIIYPTSTYVVDYGGWSGLILIGLVDRRTGVSLPSYDVCMEGFRLGLRTLRLHTLSVEEVVAAGESEQSGIEGWVLRYSNGLMVKVKTTQYRTVFRVLMGLSTKALWGALAAGMEFVMPVGTRDDVRIAVDRETALFRAKYAELAERAERVYEGRPQWAGARRKDVALHFLEEGAELAPVLFAMLDGRDWGKVVWKLLEPRMSARLVTHADPDALDLPLPG